MAVSGTYTFQPTNSEIIDEAFERVGVDPSEVVARHLRSAIRSMNLLFSDWANKGVHQWKLEQVTQALTQATASYTLPTGTIDIMAMASRRTSGGTTSDVPMHRISRDDYLEIADKTLEGRPSQFWVDRDRETPEVTVWNTPENSTDVLVINYLLRIQDAGKLSDNPEIPFNWFEAICAGLARRLYMKVHSQISGTFDPSRYAKLKQEEFDTFNAAKDEDRDRAPTRMSVKL
jgi:hypothetical protein